MSKEMIKPEELARPAYLASAPKKGMEVINRIVAPPTLVIVQSQSDKLIEAGFGAGDVVMMPAQELVSDTLTVVPLLFFTEYICLNPREAKDLPMIRERSFDDNSEIAAKCRALEEFPCPESPKHFCKYQQNLVFVVFVEELQMVTSLRFYRSEFKVGRVFASKIKARNASVFAGRYVIQCGIHKNDKGRWHGWDFKPTDRPWVSEEEYATFEQMHDELAAAHAANALQIQDEEQITDVEDGGKF